MLNFITLYAQDIGATARVYEALGLIFVEERHGDGPVHLSCEREGQVLEIYPGLDAPSRSALLGFTVDDLTTAEAALRAAGAEIIKQRARVAGLDRVVASDPDGRELFVMQG